MEIKEGYLYHISRDFFELVDDPNLPINHSGVHSRPSYFLVKDKDLLWFIPLSSKVDKYKKIIANKKEKYGRCNTVLIRRIANKDSVILIQNAFPTLDKYIDHIHLLDNGRPAKVIDTLQDKILNSFKYLLKLKSKGINIFLLT